jgi:hypothetical protein
MANALSAGETASIAAETGPGDKNVCVFENGAAMGSGFFVTFLLDGFFFSVA